MRKRLSFMLVTVIAILCGYHAPVVAAESEFTPTDYSSAIVNAGFDANNANGWSFEPAGNTGAANNFEYEVYNKVFDMYQTITGIPSGQYKLTVQGFHRAKGNDGGADYSAGTEVIPVFLYAKVGDDVFKTALLSLYAEEKMTSGGSNGYPNSMGDARTQFDKGLYTGNVVENISVTNGTLTIGIRHESTNVGASWSIFDGFTLTFMGSSVAGLTTDIANAELFLSENASAKCQLTTATALQDAITAANAILTEDDPSADALSIAALNLSKAIKAMQTSIADYTALAAAIDAANTAKINYESFAGYGAFETAITAASTAYDAGTATAATIDSLKDAERTCRLTETAPANFTFTILNPDANDGNGGWTIEGGINTPLKDQHWLGTNPANPYFDGGKWGDTGWTTTLSQTINGLPAGRYILKSVSRASEQVTMTLSAKTGAYSATVTCPSVGSTKGSIWEAAETGSTEKGVNGGNGYGWSNNQVAFDLLKGESLSVVFNATTVGHQQWFSVDQFELQYVSADPNEAPAKPVLPEITATPIKPVTTGSYAIYHPASKKLLSNDASVGAPVLNDYGYIANADAFTTNNDAYKWTVTVAADESITLQQASSQKYMNASTANAWGIQLGNLDASTEATNVSRWVLSDVTDGYNFAAGRAAAGKIVGVDGLTGNNVGIYYDKGTDKNPLFQFIQFEDLLTPELIAYDEALAAYKEAQVIYDAKQKLITAITRVNTVVAGQSADYTSEATSAFNTAMSAVKDIYFNEDASLEEINDAVPAAFAAMNAYLMSAITASDEEPADVSFLIFNPDFSTTDVTYWNGATGTATGGTTNVYEMFQKSNFDMNQVLKSLPAGYYQLSAQGFAREKANDKGAAYTAQTENIIAYLYAKAGEVKTDVKFVSLYSEPGTGAAENMGYFANNVTEASAAFVAGKYNNSTATFFLNEGEDLTIGALYDGASVNGSWTCYDNFKLIYKGNTLNTLIKELQAEIELAKAITGTMQKTVAFALSAAILDAEDAIDFEVGKEDLEAAQAKLAEAVAAAKASITVYAKLPVAIAEAEASSVAEEPAVVAAISAANEVYTTATVDADGIATAIKALKLAVNTQIVADITDGDYTELIVNPAILQKGGIQTRPWGWENSTNSGTNGNFTKEAGTEEAPKNTYLEAWNNPASTIVFDYNQTIFLPNGIYQVGAATFTEATNGNAVLYGNEVTTPMLVGAGFPTGDDNIKTEINTSLEVIVTDNELRIGIKTIGVLDKAWCGADYFTLTYLGAGMNDLKEELTDSLAVANLLKAGAGAVLIVKAEMNKLEAAITEGTAAKDSEVLDEVFGAIGSLKTAIVAARTSIELCSALIPLFTEATTLITTYGGNVDASDLEAVLDKNYAMYQNQTDETDNAAIVAAKAEMTAAVAAYIEKVKTVGVGEINSDDVKVYVNGSTIVVEGADYEIYTQGGILITDNSAPLIPGIYIVKVAGQTVKVAVK